MILKYSNLKYNTKTYIYIICDKCGVEQRRFLKSYIKLQQHTAWNMDYCKKCWDKVRQNTPEFKLKMSNSIKNMISNNPEWKEKIKKSNTGKHTGENNAINKPGAKEKMGKTRSEKFKNDPNFRKIYSDSVKKAWANRKFEGVNTGQCKWFEYKHSNDKIYKVQGTWELKFIQWLDRNNMKFECHKGRISYNMNGDIKNYYPDFYVYDWGCYVDIKCNYFYNLQKDKFKALQEYNKDLKIKILLQDELKQLNIL